MPSSLGQSSRRRRALSRSAGQEYAIHVIVARHKWLRVSIQGGSGQSRVRLAFEVVMHGHGSASQRQRRGRTGWAGGPSTPQWDKDRRKRAEEGPPSGSRDGHDVEISGSAPTQQYFTQTGLLSLKTGGELDRNGPNVLSHCITKGATLHPIDASEFTRVGGRAAALESVRRLRGYGRPGRRGCPSSWSWLHTATVTLLLRESQGLAPPTGLMAFSLPMAKRPIGLAMRSAGQLGLVERTAIDAGGLAVLSGVVSVFQAQRVPLAMNGELGSD